MSVRFDRPPIHELALSAQFGPLPGLTTAHLGAIWQKHFRGRFPELQEHDVIHNVVERFAPGPARHQVRFQVGREPGRVWFVSDTGHELVQIQPDRFVRNWRRLDDGEYLGFTRVREDFAGDLQTFMGAVTEDGGPELVFTQCEVTYIDHAFADDGFAGHAEVDRVVRGWDWPTLPAGVEPERLTLRGSFIVRDETGEPWARVHTTVNPVFRTTDRKPLLAMETTVRGAPLAAGIEGVLAFLQRAHDAAIDLFVASTTDHIHGVWGLQRDA